ncbi:flagellar basal body rod protein FlgC [Microbaculum marinisediminis]|uniref:Flagellar basal-body rod protein FlgC n=1 Tax=Microbaculum marinisediminis TaxID=2931392 RepID=A0AAW5QX41_9HYPH|nr:flagellar basal body rod protein FlgC [Microbaculum sp. A6E488]MCT8972621.1 flagellar basal body rod protein FlgC [Microbaculum sp. A6E488]
MDLMKSLKIAAAGLRAQSSRMRIVSENLANADSTARTAGGDPYRRQIPTFKADFDRELGAHIVKPGRVREDMSEFSTRYEPGHPAADAKGYVKTANVSTLVEMMDMREAQRSYEANLNIVRSARTMIQRTLDILRA